MILILESMLMMRYMPYKGGGVMIRDSVSIEEIASKLYDAGMSIDDAYHDLSREIDFGIMSHTALLEVLEQAGFQTREE